MASVRSLLGFGCLLAVLAGCDDLMSVPTSAPPPPPKVETPDIAPRSDQSLALASYYRDVERNLVAQDLLRRDGGGIDTPFSKRQLVENFVRIATFNEFTLEGDQYIESPSEGRIQRWTSPVRVALSFGPQAGPYLEAQDRPFVEKYLSRLGRLTGTRISTSPRNANFHVAILTVDEIEDFAPTLVSLVPGLSPSLAAQITDIPRPVYCSVYAFSSSETPDELLAAVAIIRAEHPTRLRHSCYHEEIAQGLGLSNDSPAARPSIFNDDDEFGLLTRHDELLLKMLYDPRMPLGAGPEEARAVAEVVAAELIGGES